MNGLAAPTLPRTASGGLTAARDADCGASHSAAPSGRAGTCVHCGHVATRTVAGCDKLGGARGYRKRRRMLRPAQPRPPFPACFQVTHRKIFLFSAVFRLTVANVSGVCVRNQHAPPRILDEDSPPQPQAAISDDARRHTCPCKPFYWVIHGVPPRIRYTSRIRAFRPSKSRSPVRVRPGMRSMGARARSVNARNANMCPVGREPRARGWRHANSAGSHMGHGQHARLRDGASAMGSTRERPPRPRKPRPPFPACFQVTH